VIERAASYAFNSFRDPAFADAVRAESRDRLGHRRHRDRRLACCRRARALREGYEAYVVVDAVASRARKRTTSAIQRMIMSASFRSPGGLAAEFQLDEKFTGRAVTARN